jgi:hypothetical protein
MAAAMTCEQYDVVPDTTRVNIVHNAGEPFELTVPILDDNDEPVSIPPGTEGDWLARAQVRRNHYATAVLHEWVTTGGTPNAVIVPGAESAVLLTATADETAAWLDWPDYSCAWDLWLTEPFSGGDPPDPSRLAKGAFRLCPSTTR